MYITEDVAVAKKLQDEIQSGLDRLGLLCRVFSRAKSASSLNKKIEREPGKYSLDGKKIQDVFGVRVALYFPDDQPVAVQLLQKLFNYDAASSAIDNPSGSVFSATRCNLIFELPEKLVEQSTVFDYFDCLDKTFEVQVRTILSEGWHEVEHDLRYKCQSDWDQYKDLDRALNGIYASLETSDWSMMKVFESLAYRHYKASEWSQMIRTKFRLRLEGGLSEHILDALKLYPAVGKKIFRVDRGDLLQSIANTKLQMPVTPDNIVYLCNYCYVGFSGLSDTIPRPLFEMFSESGIKIAPAARF